MEPLDVRMFGVIFGCAWGFGVLMVGLISLVSPQAMKVVKLFGKVYVGYTSSCIGVLIGAFWGFIDGAISGMLMAWIFNIFIR